MQGRVSGVLLSLSPTPAPTLDRKTTNDLKPIVCTYIETNVTNLRLEGLYNFLDLAISVF